MGRDGKTAISRRMAVLGGAGAAAVALVPRLSLAQSGRAVQSGGGVAGGGTVKIANGVANFSVIATRFMETNSKDPILFGHVSWMDTTGFGFESKDITTYQMVKGDVETSREVIGTATLSTGAEQPFRLYIVEGGAPGSGKDTVELTVGPADNTVYTAKGPVVTGDIQLIKFEFPTT
jgi:hypothetical protein